MKNNIKGPSENVKAMMQTLINQAYAEGLEAGKEVGKHNNDCPVCNLGKGLAALGRIANAKVAPVKTANQQRSALIRKSLHIMHKLKNKDGYYEIPTQNGVLINAYASFQVNKDKKTVTCVLRERHRNYVCKRATARCHPIDVFNDNLGMLVSLLMCLELVIPQEFLDAVQPDDWAVGQIVTYPKRNRYHTKMNYRIDSVLDTENNLTKLFEDGKANADLTDGKIYMLPIIDDTNAIYSEV